MPASTKQILSVSALVSNTQDGKLDRQDTSYPGGTSDSSINQTLSGENNLTYRGDTKCDNEVLMVKVMFDDNEKDKKKYEVDRHSRDQQEKSADTAIAAKADAEPDRDTWGNQVEFILSCLGFAVGFGNVWRFPYLCYKNGGAVFLIPYLTMLACAGLPMFLLELALGQYAALGPTSLFPRLSPLLGGLGLSLVCIPFLVCTFFDVIMAWSLFYIFSSFTAELPWGTCENSFNTPKCASIEDMAGCKAYNTTPYYYDGDCRNVTEMCAVGGLEAYNATTCGSASEPVSPTVAAGIVSSAEEFYREGVLGVGGATWEHFGSLQWGLTGCLVLGWLLTALCLLKGIKSSGKAVYFTSLFPYVILTILFAFGLTRDGAGEGLRFYLLNIDFSKLMEVEVWQDAATQLFFSLGPGYGTLITLASYNPFHANCMRNAAIVAFLNSATSIYAGLVLFSILGGLAHEMGVPVDQVVSSGSGLAFVAYPEAVLTMPVPQLWAVLFFGMFLSIGMSSQFAFVETITTALYDQWPPLRRRKPLVVACVCGALLLCGLPMCFQGGVFLFEIYNGYVAGLNVIILTLIELLLVNFAFGNSRLMSAIRKEMGIAVPAPLRAYWRLMWLAATPVSLLFILVMSLLYWQPVAWGDYVLPPQAQTVGWVLAFGSLLFLPAAAARVLLRGELRGAALYRGVLPSAKQQALPDPCGQANAGYDHEEGESR